MKKFTILSVLLFAFIGFSFGAVHFQQGFATTSAPVDWDQNTMYFNSTANHGDYTGNYGAGFNATGDWLRTEGMNTAGTLSFWIKGTAATSKIGMKIQTSTDAGFNWDDIVVYPKNTFNNEWQLISIDINDNSSLVMIRFYIHERSGNSLYIDDIQVTDFEGGGVLPPPTFTPPAGTYYEAQTVSMSVDTKGDPVILYTVDGSIPDDGSILYEDPIEITTTTTLKAITFTGVSSTVTTGVYVIETPTPTASIADLRANNDNKNNPLYILNNEVILTFKQDYRGQKYIEDATGAILIDDDPGIITTNYNIGDGISGIIGTLSSYKGMLQFRPVADPGAASSTGNPVVPTVVTAAEFEANFDAYEAMLLRVNGLTFDDAGGTFAVGTVYNMTGLTKLPINLEFRTSFYAADYIGDAIPATEQDIIGIANDRDNPYLTARSAADVMPAAPPPPEVPLGSTGIMIVGLLLAGAIVIRKGKLF